MFKGKWIIAALAAALSVPALAHHSTAMFDRDKRIWVEGTVKEWQWTNPHAWLQVYAPDPTGKIVEQGFEIGAPNTLIREGFRKDSFKPGEKVKIFAAPRRDSSLGGLYYCARNSQGKWLVFGMGPGYVGPPECKD